MQPALRPIQQISPVTDPKQIAQVVSQVNQAISQINQVIHTLNISFGLLDNGNIIGLNWVPLGVDKLPATGYSPAGGNLEAITVAGTQQLEMYDSHLSAWEIIARQDYVIAALAALVNSNYTHSHGGNTGSGTSGGASAGTAHTHGVGPLTVSSDTHTHIIT